MAVGVPELKWSRTGDRRCGRAAERFIEEAFRHIDLGLRVDVLIWDTQDARHRSSSVTTIATTSGCSITCCGLHSRSDRAAASGGSSATEARRRLGHAARLRECRWPEGRRAVDLGGFLSRERYALRALREARSDEEPLVQMADLFAGPAVFSRAKYSGYASWARHSTQPSLFEWEQEASRNDRVRFHLLQGL